MIAQTFLGATASTETPCAAPKAQADLRGRVQPDDPNWPLIVPLIPGAEVRPGGIRRNALAGSHDQLVISVFVCVHDGESNPLRARVD